MTDIEIIEQALKDNKEGIYPTDTHFLVPMRITGTGITQRHIIDEAGKRIDFDLERPVEEFTSDKFLKACVGLPVVLNHPDNESNKLDFDNYHEYIIGNIIYPYVKDNEVWGYARINDLKFLTALEEDVSSTSPMVESKNYIDNGKLKEHFKNINHLAVVLKGRWDNEKPAIAGDVINIDKGVEAMQENEKAKEDVKSDSMSNQVQNATSEAADKVDKKCDAEDTSLLAKDVSLDKDLLETNRELLKLMKEQKNETEIRKIADITYNSDKSPEQKAEEIGGIVTEIKEGGVMNNNVKEEATPKVDEEKGVDKRQDIDEITAIAMKPATDFKGGEKEKAETIIKKAEEMAYNPSSDANKKTDEEEIIDEKAEKEKTDIVNKIASMADSADAEINILRPSPRSNEKAHEYLNRFLNLNKGKVASKFQGLIGKVDSSTMELGKDALSSVEKFVKDETNRKAKEIKKGTRRTLADGSVVSDLLGGI